MFRSSSNKINWISFCSSINISNDNNRWVKLATVIPWDNLEKEYSSYLNLSPQPSIRLAIGVTIIQKIYNLSYSETAALLQENPYLQYFCGFNEFDELHEPIDSKTVESFCKEISHLPGNKIKNDLSVHLNNIIDLSSLFAGHKSPFQNDVVPQGNKQRHKFRIRPKSPHQNSPIEATSKSDIMTPLAPISDFLFTQNETLQLQLLRAQFVIRLVGGKFHSNEEIEYHAHLLHIDISSKYWTVLQLVFFENFVSPSETEQILEICRTTPTTNGHCYVAEFIGHPGICILLHFTCDSSPEVYSRDWTNTLKEHLLKSGITSFRIGVSSACTSPLDICRASYEADAAMETLSNQHQILCFFNDEPTKFADTATLPNTMELMLVSAISRGDRNIALSALDSLLDYIKENDRSFLITRLHCSELSRLLIDTIQKLNIPNHQENWTDLFIYNDVQTFFQSIRALTKELCQQILFQKELNSIRERERILEFIENNFTDINFSLDFAADQLAITKSKISSIVKEDLGLNFSQYISMLRLKEVKRQLIDTQKPIQDIIKGVGYIDVPNFSRRFKLIEGMTPGNYRKFHSTQECTTS